MAGRVVIRLAMFRGREISVFHVRAGGCAGCGEIVDMFLSAPFHRYGYAPRASKRRSGKARDRGVLLQYAEGAERSRCGCSGARMPAYLWSGALGERFRGAPRVVECDTPRHADIVVVTGSLTEPLSEAAIAVISQAPATSRLLLVGDCALGEGPMAGESPGTDKTVGLETELIQGCPVTLESLVKGVPDVTR